jgi:glutathione S-transferase
LNIGAYVKQRLPHYAPFLQRFSLVEQILQTGLLGTYPRIQQWTDALLPNDCVKTSVAPGFPEVFQEGLRRRGVSAAELMG